ncbi:BtrH N-terminal domain-containing protein [Flavobacterium sp. xlx-214]|uniref:BtrH N-terminal domain-containing protein n=1 Tax=unclassified Flavobacterium TaxID=196869 RepID=UPI0013D1F57B|nr:MULTISPECIES: BtrH N-terminal domain-containing protein [unclassified Flavobacterium]MBA5792110.1 BtrH N-terminal domain-containing protein [Flavobacterium sp. xlx-221]QMI84357.1 BtrH N-terminal domain-containing protein [Flavobacterium sp. xlx-214]
MQSNFQHIQTAHCENGAIVNLLSNKGYTISEPMAFGLGSGLFFVYLPFIKVNHAPAISYRPLPGVIFNRMAKRLGIKIKRFKFSDPKKAQQKLDENLAQNIPTGCVVGVYNLPYFPDEYRFHFNAHNIVVFGKEGNNYLISDPVLDYTVSLTEDELEKVRFAKGALAPKGHLYYPIVIPDQIDLTNSIKQAIKKTCNDMLAPVPIVGVKGMRMVAKAIVKWHKKLGVAKANYNLANLVRMQEEIGTGGGGFRFIYAAFLQEAGVYLKNDELIALSKEMAAIGDNWRDFALEASRVVKKRSNTENVYQVLSQTLLEIADKEEAFFKKLKKAV